MTKYIPRTIIWFSCGAASAVAGKITLDSTPEAIPVYCDTGAEHEDNKRFLKDCEKWFKKKITIIKSKEYKNTWDVYEKTRYLAGIKGARCTTELKIGPRLEFQKPTDIHVFGYTSGEEKRANLLKNNYPELIIKTPLIDKWLDKNNCLGVLKKAGIEIPTMYKLGFYNNNCIGCTKATSPSYWALVRQEFPEIFNKMAKLSRSLNVRLCILHRKRAFIDEIPLNYPTNYPMSPSCDFLCNQINVD